MDIGTVAIYLSQGQPQVARCESAPAGLRFVPATNAEELAAEATRVLAAQGVSLDEDGLYLCPDHLIAAAQFPPLAIPADAITYGAAREILYPDVEPNTGWQRVRRDAEKGLLQIYRVGVGQDTRRYVSRSAVVALATQRKASVAAA